MIAVWTARVICITASQRRDCSPTVDSGFICVSPLQLVRMHPSSNCFGRNHSKRIKCTPQRDASWAKRCKRSSAGSAGSKASIGHNNHSSMDQWRALSWIAMVE